MRVLSSVSLQARGFFKGMAFPFATVGLLNSLFFGVYANTLRLWADKRAPTPTPVPPKGNTEQIPQGRSEAVSIPIQAGCEGSGSGWEAPPNGCDPPPSDGLDGRGTPRDQGTDPGREGGGSPTPGWQEGGGSPTQAREDAKRYGAILLASAFAGAVQGVPACPIDLVKVRLQAQTTGGCACVCERVCVCVRVCPACPS